MSSLSEANRLYMKKLYKEAVLKYQDACGESPALNELHFNNMARVERAINRRPLSEQEVQAGVSIVIPAVSASELKKGLLSQIVENNSYDDIEVVIVDGSTGRNIDSALMSFRKHTSIKCVDGGGRVSFASLCNLGAGNATKKYIMFLPSYITLSSDIVPMCIKLVNDFDLAGLGMASTGPGRDSFSHLGFDFTHNPDAGYAAPREITEKRSLTRATVGFCDAISGDVFFCNRLAFHEAGGFDESYLSRLAIPDLCLRLGNNGKKFWCIKSTPLDFLEGVRGQLVRDDPQTSVDHKVFKNKWSSYIGHRSSNDPLRIGRAKKEVIFRGRINTPSQASIVTGWAAQAGSESPVSVELEVDGRKFSAVADQYRRDLEGKVNRGDHAFTISLPSDIYDGKRKKIVLYEKKSGKVLHEITHAWEKKRSRNYINLQSMLQHCLTNPLIEAPFREEDKRCFAVLEKIADRLATKALAQSNPPLISVVMPVYNRETIVVDAIESVLSQRYTNFELLIVDDASTDGTYKSIEAFNDNRIVRIKLEKNSGQCIARNTALARAKGDYIAYLDSDNSWEERYLATMVGASMENPDADFFYSGMYLFKSPHSEPFAVRYGHYNKNLLLNRNYIDTNVIFHKRKIFDETGGFDETLMRYPDYDKVLKIAETYRIVSVPVVLCNYFYGKDDYVMTNNDRYADQIKTIWKEAESRRETRIKLDSERIVMERGVSIVIPSYNSLEDLKECLSAIEAIACENIEIICVDNKSDDCVVNFLDELDREGKIRLIKNQHNYGFTFAVNQGIGIAKEGNDILLLNNDAVMNGAALKRLQTVAHEKKDAGATVPAQVLPAGEETISVHVPYANKKREADVNISAHHNNVSWVPLFHDGVLVELTYAPFFAVYLKREVVDELGALDAEFGRHYRSDRAYSDMIREVLGKKIYYVADAIVRHKLQRSTSSLRSDQTQYDAMFIKNKWPEDLRLSLGIRQAVWDF